MSVINLAGMATFPNGHSATAADADTWQAFTLDPAAVAVTVHNEDDTNGLYIAFDNMGTANAEQPTDGGAVGTHRIPLPAGTAKRWDIRSRSTQRVATTIFIARAAGTPAYTVEQEIA